MPVINTVLVATDFSEYAASAESRAAVLAREHACSTIELMTVKESIQPDVLAQMTDSTVEAAVQIITIRTMQALQSRSALLKDKYGVECTFAVRFGMPAHEIAARADETAADLIVAGAHGGNFLSRLFLGNTASKLAHLCQRPLLIVKNAPEHGYRNVLVLVDFSEDAHHAAQMAVQIAPQAALTFLHAYEVWYEGALQYANVDQDVIDTYRLKEQDQARLAMNQLIREIGADSLPIKCVIKSGMPWAIIHNYAETHRPDLIVVGKHGRSHLEKLLLGSITRDVLAQTDIDTLIVPIGAQAP